jgi:hypothetical protein
MTINKDGKRYYGENKIFNDMDLKQAWNNVEEDPNGDKVVYYLRKKDGLNEDGTQRWLYKPGLAKTSAYERYLGQLDPNEWELLAEKRFDGASTLEKQIHGNKEALANRAFDYGRFNYKDVNKEEANAQGRAYSDFGAGTSELYTKDILGVLPNTTAESRAKNKALSELAYEAELDKPYMANDTFEFIDAFQAAGQTAAGKFIKAAGQGISNIQDALTGQETTGDGAIEAYGKKLMEDAASDWGYNDSTMKSGLAQMKSGLREGSPINFFIGLAKAAPQAVAGSVPEAAAYLGGGPTSLALRAGALAIANANDQLDAREIANGGKKASAKEIAAVMGAETLASLLDMGSLRFITKGLPGLGIANRANKAVDFKKAISSMPSSTKYEMMKSLAKGLARGTGEFATEATQEATTEAIRMLNETLGTTKYGDNAKEILQSVEGTKRLEDSLLLGGAGGVGFGLPKNLKHTGADIATDLKVGNRLKAGAQAGKGASSQLDAELKKMYSEEFIKNAETTINNLNTTSENLEKATTAQEVYDVMAESDLPIQLKNNVYTLVTDPNAAKDIGVLKETLHEVINKARSSIMTEAQANYQANEGLKEDIKQDDLGEELPQDLEKIDSMSAEHDEAVATLNEHESNLQALTKELKDAKDGVEDSRDINVIEAEYNEEVAARDKAQDNVDTLMNDLADRVIVNEIPATKVHMDNMNEALDNIHELNKLEATPEVVTEIAKNYDVYKESVAKIEELSDRIDEDYVKSYDPVGAQVEATEEVAQTVGQSLNPSRKKESIAGKIFKAIISKGKSLKKVKGSFSKKLKNLSTEALTQLASPEEINKLDKLLTGTNGYKPFTKYAISKAIKDELKNRKVSDEFFDVGGRLEAGEGTETDPISIGKRLGELKNIKKTVEANMSEYSPEELEAEATAYVKKVSELLHDIRDMNDTSFKKLSKDGSIEGLTALKEYIKYFENLAKTNDNEQFAEAINLAVEEIEDRITREESDYSKQSYIFKIAKATEAQDEDAILMAEKYLQDLKDDDKLTDEQADTLSKALDNVKQRSILVNEDFLERVAEKEMQTVEEIDQEIKDNPDMDEKVKEMILEYPPNMKIQLMNVFGVIDDETLRTLQGLGIDIDSLRFENGQETISVNIC